MASASYLFFVIIYNYILKNDILYSSTISNGGIMIENKVFNNAGLLITRRILTSNKENIAEKFYSYTGSLVKIVCLNNNMKEGISDLINSDGSLATRSFYKNDKRYGNEISFYSNPTLVLAKIYFFKDSETNCITEFFSNGIASKMYLKNFTSKMYLKNFRFSERRFLQNGEVDKKWDVLNFALCPAHPGLIRQDFARSALHSVNEEDEIIDFRRTEKYLADNIFESAARMQLDAENITDEKLSREIADLNNEKEYSIYSTVEISR
jgi:antitoxin component YwqK of YwqJK toxin-antitoxin module